jgi:hypothetical protein
MRQAYRLLFPFNAPDTGRQKSQAITDAGNRDLANKARQRIGMLLSLATLWAH